jgi:beta-galactosidase
LVNADRTPHPALNEVRKVYQPIYFKEKALDKGEIELTNLHQFTDLNAYNYRWIVLKNGQLFAEGTFAASGKPYATVPVRLSLPSLMEEEGVEYFLTVQAEVRTASPIFFAGQVVASEQFALSGESYFAKEYRPSGTLVVTEKEDKVVFESGSVRGTINLKTGLLTDYVSGGKTLLKSAPTPNFWRAANDNDYGADYNLRANAWRAAGDNRTLISAAVVRKSAEELVVKAVYKLNDTASDYELLYRVYSDGAVSITSQIEIGAGAFHDLPRFGLKMELPLAYDSVAYYGRGPWENYSDRCRSAFMGVYSGVVDDLKFDYIRPQENGYRTALRTLTLVDKEGNGIRIDAEGVPFCINARHNTDNDLDAGLTKKQQHTIDVDPRSYTVLNVDLAQRGVGGDNAWGAQPMEKYRLLGTSYRHSFRISAVK